MNKIKEWFKDLKFDEKNHRYTVAKTPLTSVSKIKSTFQEEVDFNKIAGYVAKSRKCSKEEVLAEWEQNKNEACDLGNEVHNFAENYKKGDKPKLPQQKAFVKWWNKIPKHIKPIYRELQMYCWELNIAGTADLILYNEKTGKYRIYDYKTNKDLYKNYKNKKLLYPFEHLLDNPLNLYFLQLSLYKYLFELTGEKVEKMCIIWFKLDGTYKEIEVKDYKDLIIKTIKERI